MPYPNLILPKKEYKDEINIDSLLLNNNRNILVRRSSVTEFSDPENIKLREICYPTKEFVGLSSNLLGRFEIEWIVFVPTNRPSNDYWQKTEGDVDSVDIEFYENHNLPVFIDISDLHGQTCPATKDKGLQTSKTINLKIKVCHKPQKPNYWHLEVRLTDAENIELNRESLPDWQKRGISSFLDTHFMQMVSAFLPHFDIIDEDHFMN